MNILIIINTLYHIYIESELYKLVYEMGHYYHQKIEFLNVTMGKCTYHDTLTKIL